MNIYSYICSVTLKNYKMTTFNYKTKSETGTIEIVEFGEHRIAKINDISFPFITFKVQDGKGAIIKF